MTEIHFGKFFKRETMEMGFVIFFKDIVGIGVVVYIGVNGGSNCVSLLLILFNVL